MSDVLQLSGPWATIDGSPAGDRQTPTPASDVIAAATRSDDRATEPSSATSPADRVRRRHSAATPYVPYVARLVQRLFLTTDRIGDPIRSVMFAGVDPRERSALLPAAAAELLTARVNGRICLVDANFESPSLHDCYGVSNDIGLCDALSGAGPVRSYARRLSQGETSSLWLLPAGRPKKNLETLLAPEAAETRVRDLIAAFDFVVVASAPATERSTAASLGAHVDGIVMVVAAHARRRAVRACADAFRSSGGRVLGAVLSNRTFPIPESVYRLL